MAKRESGAMLSHHRASSPAGTATHSNREQHEKCLQQHRRHSSLYFRKPSPAAFRLFSLLVVLVSWTSLLGSVAASEAHGDRRTRRSAPLHAVLVDDTAPAWKGPSLLIIDTRPPPPVPPLMPPLHNGDATRTTSAPPSKRSVDTDPNASDADFEIPKPFDSALSNNFTNNCADFFKRMLTSDTVNNCHPFSLMLQTSTGLFDASKSFVRITQTLEATCAANSTQCEGGMDALARELTTDAACKVDYNNNNPQVVQAYNGLITYEQLYQASCLRDDDGNYCYASAVTNTTSAGADAYPYYLPLGVSLPGGARPTCNSCLQKEMAIFSTFAGNTTQPVSQTYTGAAQQIGIYCGATFVNQTAVPLKGAASVTTASLTPTLSLFIMLLFFFLQ